MGQGEAGEAHAPGVDSCLSGTGPEGDKAGGQGLPGCRGLIQMQEALGGTCLVRPTAVQTSMSSVLARASDISPSTKQATALRLRPCPQAETHDPPGLWPWL